MANLSPNFEMADSINPAALPTGLRAYAGYVGGHWPDYSEIVKRFPKALHKSVAVNAGEDADILDIENGDATPPQASAWFRRQKVRGHKLPGFYASASVMPEVIRFLTAAGIHRSEYVLWEAWFRGFPFISADRDAEQWFDHGPQGQNYDRSLVKPSFFHTNPSPPVVNHVSYRKFSGAVYDSPLGKLVERNVVQRYDTARKHPKLPWNHLRLRNLREQCGYLADRIEHEAFHFPLPDGRIDWRTYSRGWRRHQLRARQHGTRLV